MRSFLDKCASSHGQKSAPAISRLADPTPREAGADSDLSGSSHKNTSRQPAPAISGAVHIPSGGAGAGSDLSDSSHKYTSLPVSPASASSHTDQTSGDRFFPTKRLLSQKYCMKSSIVGQSLDRSHVVVIPLPCKSWDCPICGPRKRAALVARLEASKPERELTLTCPVGKFLSPQLAAQAMKAAWTKLIARARKQWGPQEYAMVWELTKKGVPHIHILLRGSYIAQKWVSRQWERLGIGPIVYIQSVKGNKLHAAHACKYLAKSNGQSAKILAPLHVVQISKGYDLDHKPRTAEQKYPDHVWVWDRLPAWEVTKRFFDHDAWRSTVEYPNGVVEIEMAPHPDPDFTEETAAFWVAWPGIAPRDYLDG
ncbi:hypothetical protein ES705_34647 [subsurface metagenome]